MINELHSPVMRISGPPGTGKTTFLINLVEDLLEKGVEPERIAYTTFSRAGAKEAIDRAVKRFGLARERFKWFRTLHSLCYKFSSSRRVMGPRDMFHIGHTHGIRFSRAMAMDDGSFFGKNKGDVMLNMIHLARVQNRTLPDVWKEHAASGVSQFEVEYLAKAVADFKKESGKIDYTDMLEQFCQRKPKIEIDFLIVDESQDSSALQWNVIRHLSSLVKQTYVAGDDDQCIHEWNGASAAHFIKLKCDEDVLLKQSYRVPRLIHEQAARLIQRIKNRVPKEYLPRDIQGEIKRVGAIHHINLRNSETWLILSRNTWNLADCAAFARQSSTLYHYEKEDQGYIEALEGISAWERLLNKESVTRDEAMTAYSFMESGNQLQRGAKTLLESADADEPIDLTDLELSYGLKEKKHWMEQLSKLPKEAVDYFKRVAEHEPLASKPRVRITTIHGAKGLEADNVVLLTDLSRACAHGWVTGKEEEIRVLYVALTRTKNRLFLVNPKSYTHYGI